MANCHEMKQGEVYQCITCGLEVTVTNECKDRTTHNQPDSCCAKPGECQLTCCGTELTKK